MQLPENRTGPIKNLVFYLKDAIRFHEVGVPLFVQIVFVAMVAILFGGYVLALPYAGELNRISLGVIAKLQEMSAADPKTVNVSGVVTPDVMAGMLAGLRGFLGFMLCAKILVHALSLFYAYLWHLKRITPDVPFAMVVKGFLMKIPFLLGNNLVFYGALVLAGVAASIVFSLIGLVLPPFAILLASIIPILYFLATSVFSFRDMSILVGGTGVFKTFPTVWRLTAGCRKAMVGNMMMMYLLGMAASWVAVGISGQALVATFVAVFLEVILLLVTQRLVVRMYEDVCGIGVHPHITGLVGKVPD